MATPGIIERLRHRCKQAAKGGYQYETHDGPDAPGYDAQLDMRAADEIAWLRTQLAAVRSDYASARQALAAVPD